MYLNAPKRFKGYLVRLFSRYYNVKRPHQEVEILEETVEGVFYFFTHDKLRRRRYMPLGEFKQGYRKVT
jgi:hypothetical protein